MRKQNYSVIGVMSGTSLDGIDLAHIRFSFDGENCDFEIGDCETTPYPDDWKAVLSEASNRSMAEIAQIDNRYTEYLGKIISEFISKNRITDLDAVCSHGHTVLHQPSRRLTLQIGNLPNVADLIKQTVVCDFRSEDVALGGQGAPLVPIGDKMLFRNYDYCLNLGGFSNISFQNNGKRIAFDICPVNTVLNYLSEKAGKAFDDKGIMSSEGTIDQHLLSQLNSLDYYAKDYPKSLGIEYVNQTVIPMMEKFSSDISSQLRTFVEHIAIQTANVLSSGAGKMLITGGGAYNDFLISRMKSHLPEIEIIITSRKIIEYKEALIFALLGVLRLRDEINVLSSVTGAPYDHVSGKIYKPTSVIDERTA